MRSPGQRKVPPRRDEKSEWLRPASRRAQGSGSSLRGEREKRDRKTMPAARRPRREADERETEREAVKRVSRSSPAAAGFVKGGRPPGRFVAGRGGGASSFLGPALSRGPRRGHGFRLSVWLRLAGSRGWTWPGAFFPGPCPRAPRTSPVGRGGAVPFPAPDLFCQRVRVGRAAGTCSGARGLASALRRCFEGLADGSRPMSCGAGVAAPRPRPMLLEVVPLPWP